MRSFFTNEKDEKRAMGALKDLSALDRAASALAVDPARSNRLIPEAVDCYMVEQRSVELMKHLRLAVVAARKRAVPDGPKSPFLADIGRAVDQAIIDALKPPSDERLAILSKLGGMVFETLANGLEPLVGEKRKRIVAEVLHPEAPAARRILHALTDIVVGRSGTRRRRDHRGGVEFSLV